MVMSTAMTTAIFTTLQITKWPLEFPSATETKPKMLGRCCIEKKSNWYRCTLLTKPSPGQSLECREFRGQQVEQAFDAHKSVLAGHVVNQFVQKFPFWPGITARFDSFPESLHTPFAVGERAAFLRVRATGQGVMREFGGGVRQNVAHDERLQFSKQIRADAMLRHIFTENDERLDAAVADAVGDLRQIRAHFCRRDAS